MRMLWARTNKSRQETVGFTRKVDTSKTNFHVKIKYNQIGLMFRLSFTQLLR